MKAVKGHCKRCTRWALLTHRVKSEVLDWMVCRNCGEMAARMPAKGHGAMTVEAYDAEPDKSLKGATTCQTT